jgi:hypothetical protein
MHVHVDHAGHEGAAVHDLSACGHCYIGLSADRGNTAAVDQHSRLLERLPTGTVDESID